MKKISLLLLVIFAISCSKQKNTKLNIIPQPLKVEVKNGEFKFDTQTKLFVGNPKFEETASFLTEYFKKSSDISLNKTNSIDDKNIVIIQEDKNLSKEEYLLNIQEDVINIKAANSAGVFYAIQSIRQMLPAELEAKTAQKIEWVIPTAIIQDKPRFKWRGAHLDVSRHFFPVETIKKEIDLLALHKMNVFHWHLMDDQGWRLEIKKYPKLTSVGAWRVDREHLAWNARGTAKPGEKATYGGFYTQEQIKEVVEYARKRQITVVPEIEMPAHIMCAIAAYPHLSCTGKKIGVPPGSVWPITEIYCPGKESTFKFLEDVLTEVMELFPSKFIHIGGDEANKKEWKTCKDCQARIKKEKLKDEHELQSYFITRIEKFLNSKGRKIIGWDEILEGGLAPNAAVMSWRGQKGGIQAAKSKHQVVMTPTSHCYFDYYQGDENLEPVAFGGKLTLSRVYSYNPIPKELTKEEGEYVMGVQANLWTEHVHTPEHVEYMNLPRMTALAEVGWTSLANKNWDSFAGRMLNLLKRFDVIGLNYAKSAFNIRVNSKLDSKTKSFGIDLKPELLVGEVYYTTDGSEPTTKSNKYTKPFKLQKSATVKAAQFVEGKLFSKISSNFFTINKASFKKAELTIKPHEKYVDIAKDAYTNSTFGGLSFGDGNWVGYNGDDMETIIDLEKSEIIKTISVRALHDVSPYVFMPKYVEFYISTDKKNFKKVGKVNAKEDMRSAKRGVKPFTLKLDNVQEARYIKVFAKSIEDCPKWHGGYGTKAWQFFDEIIVE
jgi:hexosaminidase